MVASVTLFPRHTSSQTSSFSFVRGISLTVFLWWSILNASTLKCPNLRCHSIVVLSIWASIVFCGYCHMIGIFFIIFHFYLCNTLVFHVVNWHEYFSKWRAYSFSIIWPTHNRFCARCGMGTSFINRVPFFVSMVMVPFPSISTSLKFSSWPLIL